MAATIAELFNREGVDQRVAGNQPFLLDDADAAWQVAAGRVELFLVLVEAGQPVGRRYPVCSIEEGGLFLGMDIGRYGEGRGLLAVGTRDTRLRRLPISRLREAAGSAELKEGLAARLDEWIMRLSFALSRDFSPRTDQSAEDAGTVGLLSNKRVRVKKGVLWADLQEGDCLFLDVETIWEGPQRGHFPLCQSTWLLASKDSVLRFVRTGDLINQPGFWEGLHAFYKTFFNCESVNQSLALADEFNRAVQRADYSRKVRKRALAHLSSILEGAEAEIEYTAGDDRYLAACMLVGNAQGIKIRPCPRRGGDAPSKDPLQDVLNSSQVRSRRVQLSGEWWREEIGPLLGFRGEPKDPVALLPAGRGRIVMHDPATRKATAVDAAVARQIKPYALMLYKPLPERPANGVDLLRLCLHGTKSDLLWVLGTGMAAGLLTILIPLSMRHLVETTIPKAQMGQLSSMTLVLLLSIVAMGLLGAARSIALLRVESRADLGMQSAVMDRLLRLPPSFFSKYSAGDLTNRALSICLIRQQITGTTVTSLLGVLFAVFNLALLFWFHFPLALLIAVLLIMAGLANVWGVFQQMRHTRPTANLEGKISGLVYQLLSGVSKLRVAGAEAHAFAAWAGNFAEQRRLTVRARRIANHFFALNQAIPLAMILLISMLAVHPRYGTVSAGDFIAFNTAMLAFVSAMLVTFVSLASLVNVIPLYDRARPILETPPEVVESKTDPGRLNGGIELSNVSFRYDPDLPLVLKDVSLSIRPGEFVAIVGPSGSGKSSLLRLLLGLNAPESGVVSYDGQDLGTLDVQAVRRQIGVVLQHSRLAPGDILTNIALCSPLSLEEAWDAARLAGIKDDIEAMPMGMFTAVTADGGTFSGGQKQRLLIARALASRPRMVFFDEATSALDNNSQAWVSRSLAQLQATRVVIAHRLSTIAGADRIYVMDEGRIVQTGKCDELLKQTGLFAELAKRQLVSE